MPFRETLDFYTRNVIFLKVLGFRAISTVDDKSVTKPLDLLFDGNQQGPIDVVADRNSKLWKFYFSYCFDLRFDLFNDSCVRCPSSAVENCRKLC